MQAIVWKQKIIRILPSLALFSREKHTQQAKQETEDPLKEGYRLICPSWSSIKPFIRCHIGRCPPDKSVVIVTVAVVQLLSHIRLFETHGLQHTSLLCPSLSLGVCSNSRPLSLIMLSNHLILCHPCSSCLKFFDSLEKTLMLENIITELLYERHFRSFLLSMCTFQHTEVLSKCCCYL